MTASKPRKATAKPKVKTAPKHGNTRKKSRGKRRTYKVKTKDVLIVIVLVIAVVIAPHLFKNPAEYGTSIPEIEGSYGIDISHNNEGRIVWDSLMVMADSKGRTIRSLADAKTVRPVSFVIMKATEGVTMHDRRFEEYWQKASEVGLRRGAYHFYRTSKSPKAQARNFINVVDKFNYKDVGPVLDIETLHKGKSKKELNENLRTWLKIVGDHYGMKPIIYTYESFAKDYLSKDLLKEYPVWIAHYDVPQPSFQGWKIWQFTDKALVYGVPQPVDLNVMKQ